MSRSIFTNKKPISLSKVLTISPFTKEETEDLLKDIMVNNHVPVEKIPELNELFNSRIICGIDFKTDWKVFNKFEPVNKKVAMISIFGHVDHGKTALLSALKNMSTIQEVGGITQNISVYNWICNDEKLFLTDTPGHAILSSQRELIAQISDVVIIVIDAEKGIETQTIEIFKLTEKTKKRIICITKIDRKRNIDSIYATLFKYGISVKKMGGETSNIEVSVHKGFEQTIENLKNLIVEEVRDMNLKTECDHEGIGYILDSWNKDGVGLLSKVYLSCGNICTGDMIMVNGKTFNVRSLLVDDKQVSKTDCNNIFVLSGLFGDIVSGDTIYVISKEYSEYFTKNIEETNMNKYDQYIGQKDETKKYNFICKANNTSQLNVLCSHAFRYGNIIDANISAITDSDVDMATLSNAIFLLYGDFNTNKLKKDNIDFICDKVIYRIFDTLEDRNRQRVVKEDIKGEAIIKVIFNISKSQVAGCKVSSGSIKIGKDRKIKILRGEEVIYVGSVSSIKREKDYIDEAGTNTECGLCFSNLSKDITLMVGDKVISYEEKISFE